MILDEVADNPDELNDYLHKEHYFSAKYDSKQRFISYWHQIDEVRSLNPKKVLEIGVGNSFVSKYLKNAGFDLTTLDINKVLNPDVVGSVLNLPFAGESFDVVLCCEVLEHLTDDCFLQALENIYKVSKKYSIISLPDISKAIVIRIELFKIKVLRKILPIGITKKIVKNADKKSSDPKHWAIGYSEYSLGKIKKCMEKAGFKILRTYRVFENPYHRFFLLEKR